MAVFFIQFASRPKANKVRGIELKEVLLSYYSAVLE
jgi:hypothetical protein